MQQVRVGDRGRARGIQRTEAFGQAVVHPGVGSADPGVPQPHRQFVLPVLIVLVLGRDQRLQGQHIPQVQRVIDTERAVEASFPSVGVAFVVDGDTAEVFLGWIELKIQVRGPDLGSGSQRRMHQHSRQVIEQQQALFERGGLGHLPGLQTAAGVMDHPVRDFASIGDGGVVQASFQDLNHDDAVLDLLGGQDGTGQDIALLLIDRRDSICRRLQVLRPYRMSRQIRQCGEKDDGGNHRIAVQDKRGDGDPDSRLGKRSLCRSGRCRQRHVRWWCRWWLGLDLMNRLARVGRGPRGPASACTH